MNLKSVNYIFAAFILSVCCGVSVSAQNKCNLQIGVYEYKKDGSSEQFPVQDAKINLVYTKTGESLKAENNATFSAVSEGEYKITVAKNGFQKTIKLFSVDCSMSEAESPVSEVVFLWQGSERETFNPPGQTFGTSNNYDIAAGEPINKGAIFLGKPAYPAAARAVQASGTVEVQVTINEIGSVIFAKAVSGHPLLRAAAVKAAKASKFRMTFLEGIPVKVTGIIVYNFVP